MSKENDIFCPSLSFSWNSINCALVKVDFVGHVSTVRYFPSIESMFLEVGVFCGNNIGP